jgi:hypothetical protein
LFKLYQIDEYDWITKDNLDLSYDRLSKFISKNAKYEHGIECVPTPYRPELLNRRLEGYIDCIDDNKIYEFKCVQKLENEHFLQLAVYMYLYENDNIYKYVDETDKKLYKYKFKISKYLNLIEKNNDRLVKLKRKTKKLINELTLENDNYNKKIQQYKIKIDGIDTCVKPATHHIITNKYYLYNILSNEMYQIICDYNELVSMIDYLIKSKYQNNKQEIDDVFIKNNKEIYDKYYILLTEKQSNNDTVLNTYVVGSNSILCKSDKMVLDIETDGADNILQVAYNMYDDNNNLIHSKDFYIYDGKYSKPYFSTISEKDIIKKGISPENASNIITNDINNTNIIIGHNIKSFDLRCIKKLNDKFNNKIKDTLIIHDTMISSKNIINTKDKNGRLKNPRLDEMLMFLCNKTVENYHNALGDIIATFDCYKILCDEYKCFH